VKDIWAAFIRLTIAISIVVIAIGGHPPSRGQTLGANGLDLSSNPRALLCQDSWSMAVMAGPMPVELRVLNFFDDGTVELTLFDDTGGHRGHGSWSIKQSGAQTVLVIDPDAITVGGWLQHDNYIKYDEKDDAIELRYSQDGPAQKFKHVKGFRPPHDPAPK
jgi:hypothetical protein